MRHVLPILTVSLLHTTTLGQEGPKHVRTEIVRETAPGMSTLYAIDDDGTIRIDWEAVETLVTSKADRTKLPIAQLMPATRDGTWKPVR